MYSGISEIGSEKTTSAGIPSRRLLTSCAEGPSNAMYKGTTRILVYPPPTRAETASSTGRPWRQNPYSALHPADLSASA
ncbi:MAG: hypothetical protein IKQ60_03355 [Candidatus Methanomethylophilaceae archaeon]|nr:hypothetical protein [Candidatus Methanomethylophilaceae archaeon]